MVEAAPVRDFKVCQPQLFFNSWQSCSMIQRCLAMFTKALSWVSGRQRRQTAFRPLRLLRGRSINNAPSLLRSALS